MFKNPRQCFNESPGPLIRLTEMPARTKVLGDGTGTSEDNILTLIHELFTTAFSSANQCFLWLLVSKNYSRASPNT